MKSWCPVPSKLFRSSVKSTATGNARFDELLQIQRELLELKFERIEAITKQNRAAAKIESLIGENPLLRGDR
jgi:hypothetical protein